MDCGATCLAMVAKHYGKTYSVQRLREMCFATREGVSMFCLVRLLKDRVCMYEKKSKLSSAKLSKNSQKDVHAIFMRRSCNVHAEIR
ncbi:MAG: hypothetical protein LBQ31_06645 [Bacteroidales bacterium]|nr:hypothetical protein [Bacteroidales bacterium]